MQQYRILIILGIIAVFMLGFNIGIRMNTGDKQPLNLEAMELWITESGHSTYEPCNEALREAWKNPANRTPKGPKLVPAANGGFGGCCGGVEWEDVWKDMEAHGAPER